MWKQKLGMSIGSNYNIPIRDVITILYKTGFDAISPEWTSENDLVEICSIAKEYGMEVSSLHAPYVNTDKLWNHDSTVREPAMNEILMAIKGCKQNCIPILVMHTWIGFDYEFNPENLKYDAFDKIVATAQENEIKIAFENTEGEEFLVALMKRYQNNGNVGFCWDSGHEMCYNHSKDLLKEFGDRLIITHLNDNLGISRFDGKTFWTDDLHLLPFDGTADWDYNISRLRASKKVAVLNFELNIKSKPDRHENDIYSQMPLELYFSECYKRACRIAVKYVF